MIENLIVKSFLIILGLLTLFLGCIGIFLPILPTAPFLLVASICFMKSSERLNTWFKNTKLYKNNIENLVQNRSMTKSSKTKILSSISIFMIIGYIFMDEALLAKVCLLFIWLFHFIYFIFIIKTQDDKDYE